VVLFALLISVTGGGAIGCKDESGNPVDWWTIIKVPWLSHSSDTLAATGYAYLYADINTPNLQLTGKRLDSVNSALTHTLNQLYGADNTNTGWVLYNDQPPENNSTNPSFGHTKGVMIFDRNGGFWLLHSAPRWPPAFGKTYVFPLPQTVNGQSFLCTTIGTSALETVASGFLINKPVVYDSNLPSGIESGYPNISAVLQQRFITTKMMAQSRIITTTGGNTFVVFAKNAKWKSDLYEYLVQARLQDAMLVESWQNGPASNRMPSFCSPKYQWSSTNILQLTVNSDVLWPESKDHSKWGVTVSQPWICISDINRQYSQYSRGGGCACMSSSAIYNSFKSLITNSEPCTSATVNKHWKYKL